jgi:hypothetical protein
MRLLRMGSTFRKYFKKSSIMALSKHISSPGHSLEVCLRHKSHLLTNADKKFRIGYQLGNPCDYPYLLPQCPTLG